MSLEFIEIQQGGAPISLLEVGRGSATYAVLVEFEADRLLLPVSLAAGRMVIQETPNSAWLLVAGGVPSNPADWIEVDLPSAGDLSAKQDTLSSGVNIKTINNESLLGPGNITVAAGSGTYDGVSPTNQSVGGLPSGSAIAGLSLSSIIESIVYAVPPYVAPTFSSFNITGFTANQNVEVGVVMSSPLTFTWATTNSGDVAVNSISIVNLASIGTPLASALANDGSEVVAVGAPTTAAFTTSGKSFRISCTNTFNDAVTQRDLTLNGIQPWFYGKVTTATRPTAGSALLTSGTKMLTASGGTVAAPFNSGDGDFIWFAIPSTSTLKTRWHASDLNNGPIEAGSLFTGASEVSVNSPTGLWNNVLYRFYISAYQTAATSLELRNS